MTELPIEEWGIVCIAGVLTLDFIMKIPGRLLELMLLWRSRRDPFGG